MEKKEYDAKLEHIARLENELGLMGTSFAVKVDAKLSNEAAADYVLRIYETNKELRTAYESGTLRKL